MPIENPLYEKDPIREVVFFNKGEKKGKSCKLRYYKGNEDEARFEPDAFDSSAE